MICGGLVSRSFEWSIKWKFDSSKWVSNDNVDIMDHLNSSSHITAGAIAKIKFAFSVDGQSERELIRENEWMVNYACRWTCESMILIFCFL